MQCFAKILLVAVVAIFCSHAQGAGRARHVVLLVWDGMRPDFVRPDLTPTLDALVRQGVTFADHHAAYCSATEVNGTAISTGAYPRHSGIMANKDYRPAIHPLKGVDTQATEIVRKGDALTGGHYLRRPTLAEILQRSGRSTAVAGSKQVAILHDRAGRCDCAGVSANVFEGNTLPTALLGRLTNAFGRFPESPKTNTFIANLARDEWTTRVLLEQLWTNGVPSFSLLWLSEPDFSQHEYGPGSPTALTGLRHSDRKLADVLAELERRGVRDQTDVLIVSDHGFSTIRRQIDFVADLRQAGFEATAEAKVMPARGEVIVVGQGGSVLFYVIGRDRSVIRRLVTHLQARDYSGVLFTREALPGTFPLRLANIDTEHAGDVVLSLRWTDERSNTGVPGLIDSEGTRVPGQGNHASLSRFDLHNILFAAGPDFRKGLVSSLPSGNTDVAPTILWILGVQAPKAMDGRVLSEALTIPAPPARARGTQRHEVKQSFEGFVWEQYLQTSRVNDTVYNDEGNGRQVPR